MYLIGVDIGGTQLRAALLNENYEILDVFKTDNVHALSCEQNTDKLIKFIKAVKAPVTSIGIGCPGPLSTKTGTIICPPNLVGWDGFKIVNYFVEKTSIPTVLNNDGNIAALAEAILGAGKGLESVVFVGLSTGVGGGYVYNGKIVSGAHCNAAEWWNLMVSDDTRCHKNANPGSLNEQCSGSGLELGAFQKYGEKIKASDVFERFERGDKIAISLIEQGAEMLARGFANISCSIDPDIIVVGGSVARYHPEYVDMAFKRAQKYLPVPEYLRVKIAVLGDDAGIIGAALLASER